MVQLVEQMLSLNKQLEAVKIGHEKTELYGPTDEEIRIVEETRP